MLLAISVYLHVCFSLCMSIHMFMLYRLLNFFYEYIPMNLSVDLGREVEIDQWDKVCLAIRRD